MFTAAEMPEPVAPCHETQSRCLVTGASGFIGGHLTPLLAARHGAARVTALVPPRRDAREEERVTRFADLGIRVVECDLLQLDESRPPVPPCDVLYHLAGYAITEDPAGPFEVNSTGTKLLLDWLGPELRGKRVIYAGTLASIDRRHGEGGVNEATPCAPLTTYGRTKLEGERWIESQAASLGYHYSILRLCTIVGRGYRAGGMFGVFPEMLRRGALATRLNWPGRASYLSVTDLARILAGLPDLDRGTNALYVTGNSESPSFDELLNLMSRVLGVPRKRIRLPRWFWSALSRLAWLGAGAGLLGSGGRTFCWRVCHLCGDGLRADAGRLNQRLDFPLRSVEQALREAYEKP